MASKNVAIRRDVYDALARELRPGESFTKLLLRLLNERGTLAELKGVWSAEDPTAVQRRWRRLRYGG